MIFKKQIFLFITLVFVQFVFAQDGSTIKASVDKNKILIGEPIKLAIESFFSSGSIKEFIVIDSIPHFEFLEKPIIDSTNKNGGSTIKAVYQITSFDSGHWVIPSFVLSQNAKTDTIPIEVVFSNFDPNQDYHDIKDILEVKSSEKKIPWWWYVAGVVLVLGLIILYLKRKKKPFPASTPKSLISPYEEAMKSLEQLRKDKLEAKEYHTRLSNIFRLYIFRKKGILSLQKTTDDLVVQLKNLNLDKEQFDKLAQSLRLSDYVKFAKYLPSDDGNKASFEEIRNAIMTIEKTGV